MERAPLLELLRSNSEPSPPFLQDFIKRLADACQGLVEQGRQLSRDAEAIAVFLEGFVQITLRGMW